MNMFRKRRVSGVLDKCDRWPALACSEPRLGFRVAHFYQNHDDGAQAFPEGELAHMCCYENWLPLSFILRRRVTVDGGGVYVDDASEPTDFLVPASPVESIAAREEFLGPWGTIYRTTGKNVRTEVILRSVRGSDGKLPDAEPLASVLVWKDHKCPCPVC